jgi:hypothetical protein
VLQGCKVFCLQYINVATIDVPQSSSMANYLEQGDIDSAYKVACLGVTEADWRTLALAALQVVPHMIHTLQRCPVMVHYHQIASQAIASMPSAPPSRGCRC